MFDWKNLVKYVLEGGAVALAAFYIPRKNLNIQEIVTIALTAAAVFAVLDFFAPAIANGARQGAGYGIGSSLTTMTGGGEEEEDEYEGDVEEDEGFDDEPGGFSGFESD